MTDIAQLGLAIDSSQAVSATRALEMFRAAAAKAESATNALVSMTTRAEQAEQRLAAALRIAEGAATRTGAAFGGATQHATNLMFQFQDIGMMMASGQNPLMLMMQQGTQVAGVFSQSGTKSIGGALGMLRGAFTQLLNPVSLLSMGFVGLAAVAGQWIIGLFNKADETEDILERHADTVDRITDAYDAASDASARYSRMAAMEAQIAVMQDFRIVSGELTDQIDTLRTNFERYANAGQATAEQTNVLNSIWNTFQTTLRSGQADFDGLINSLGNLVLSQQGMDLAMREGIRALYDTAIAARNSANAYDEDLAIIEALEAGVKNLDLALQGLGGSMNWAAMKVGQDVVNARAMVDDMVRSAGGELRLALDVEGVQVQAAAIRKQLEAAFSGAELEAELARLDQATAAQLAGLSDRYDTAGRAAGDAADRIQETIDGLYEQATAAGLSGRELAQHEALVSAGIDANHAMADAVLAAADALYDQEAAAKAAEEAQDALLKKQEELLDAAENLGNSAWSAMMSIADGSKTAREAVADLIKQLLLAEAKAMFLRAFNPTAPMGPIMTLLSSIGARANGGPVDAGRPYLVGERGPEMIIPRSAGTVVANENLGGGSVSLTVHVEGARGNAEIEQMVERGTLAALREYDKGASRRTINSVRMARSRGVRGV